MVFGAYEDASIRITLEWLRLRCSRGRTPMLAWAGNLQPRRRAYSMASLANDRREQAVRCPVDAGAYANAGVARYHRPDLVTRKSVAMAENGGGRFESQQHAPEATRGKSASLHAHQRQHHHRSHQRR